jgi:hypothetical protein
MTLNPVKLAGGDSHSGHNLLLGGFALMLAPCEATTDGEEHQTSGERGTTPGSRACGGADTRCEIRGRLDPRQSLLQLLF